MPQAPRRNDLRPGTRRDADRNGGHNANSFDSLLRGRCVDADCRYRPRRRSGATTATTDAVVYPRADAIPVAVGVADITDTSECPFAAAFYTTARCTDDTFCYLALSNKHGGSSESSHGENSGTFLAAGGSRFHRHIRSRTCFRGNQIALSRKDGIFALVGIAPDQWVNVTVQYPLSQVGHRITAETLDGGHIISALGTTLLVGVDGAIHFEFQASHFPGFNHVALHDAAHEVGLQFWVLDQQNPGRNPPNLN